MFFFSLDLNFYIELLKKLFFLDFELLHLPKVPHNPTDVEQIKTAVARGQRRKYPFVDFDGRCLIPERAHNRMPYRIDTEENDGDNRVVVHGR